MRKHFLVGLLNLFLLIIVTWTTSCFANDDDDDCLEEHDRYRRLGNVIVARTLCSTQTVLPGLPAEHPLAHSLKLSTYYGIVQRVRELVLHILDSYYEIKENLLGTDICSGEHPIEFNGAVALRIFECGSAQLWTPLGVLNIARTGEPRSDTAREHFLYEITRFFELEALPVDLPAVAGGAYRIVRALDAGCELPAVALCTTQTAISADLARQLWATSRPQER
ncbi:MAG TPA: hypothetical protein PLV25_02310 [Opitutales bacterium]|nr:hypothetical protein [Opitutales bacterium]